MLSLADFLYSVFARSQDIIHRLLAEARREYKLQDMGNLAIWTVDSYVTAHRPCLGRR
jgi:hypothetical protein